MMMLKSIRWRLPLSYAAIALLATLALGLIMLTSLRGYYASQEMTYLQRYGSDVSGLALKLLDASTPRDAIKAQFTSLSFLSQTHLRLLDAEHKLVVDTGTPDAKNVVLTYTRRTFAGGAEEVAAPDFASQASSASDPYTSIIVLKSDNVGGTVKQWQISPSDPPQLALSGVMDSKPSPEMMPFAAGVSAKSDLLVVGAPFMLDLGTQDMSLVERSPQQVEVPVVDSSARVLGFIELSEGPAFGNAIVATVTRGWATAGVIAVLLAAAVGWFMSRGISRPLVDLTHVTQTMADGDLSARADAHGGDELGRLATSFNHMATRVEETVSTLRRFVADAAHELHTPLTALSANLELAASETMAERRAEFLQRAQEQLSRLEALTSGLLDLSRLETGSGGAERDTIDLTQLLRETSELYASRAEQAGLNFTLDVPDAQIRACVNEAQIRRVVSNLLDNAIKFTPQGEIRVGLCQQSGGVEMWVEDTGIGIPLEDQPYLFSRFHRARNAAAYPGSGLGLAILKAIVDGHDGKVELRTNSNGTRFSLRLPGVISS